MGRLAEDPYLAVGEEGLLLHTEKTPARLAFNENAKGTNEGPK
jgi:hypothetical protein